MAKIKEITIRGIRGIIAPLTLTPNMNSILVYGDNGSGKSSLTDALEWFYYDKIDHLSNEEIGRRKGRDALRNLFIPRDEDSYIAVKYSDDTLDANKSIDSQLSQSISNTSTEFINFIESSHAENLILRYRDLVSFIIAGKTDKLKELQKIIGFSEVASIRDLLRKSANRIARNTKSAGYDSQISAKQQVILDNLGQIAYTKDQFISGANELIKPLNLKKDVKSLKEIKDVLKSIETKEDTDTVERISFYTRVSENLREVQGNVSFINEGYRSYHSRFTELQQDSKKIKNLQLLSLLKEGLSILRNDVIEGDYCPLCRQEKNKLELIEDLNRRIEELEEVEKEKGELDECGVELKQTLQTNINTVDSLLKDKFLKQEEYADLKEKIEIILASLREYYSEFEKRFVDTIKEPDKVQINEKELSSFAEFASDKAKTLTKRQESNTKLHVYTKLLQSTTAYNDYLRIEREQDILTKQQATFEVLLANFIRRQETALTAFMTNFSNDINEYYTTMNPGEKVENIALVPIKNKDELVGITIQYKFYDVTRTQPTAYLSDSHINCLGLSFFLASVKAFNKKNEFFILDDVISSFDRPHRSRFVKLITNKFKDYQIFVLTHEEEFYNLMASEVRTKGWLQSTFQWTKENGVVIKEGLADSKDRIEKKFVEKATDGLGNDMRIYTENVMKRIALETEARVVYKGNDVNEKRMVSELLDAIQGKLSKTSPSLKDLADIQSMKGMPLFLENITSHDNKFQESIEDLNVVWDAITTLINRFHCSNCNKYISTKYYDNVEKRIRCKCGQLAYDWKI